MWAQYFRVEGLWLQNSGNDPLLVDSNEGPLILVRCFSHDAQTCLANFLDVLLCEWKFYILWRTAAAAGE